MDKQERTFAECRSLGHEWRKGKPLGVDDQHAMRRPYGFTTGSIGIPSHCTNCGTQKVRWMTRSGESQTRYEYPEGYSRHGDDRLTVSEWRHNYVEAIFQQFETNIRKGRKAS